MHLFIYFALVVFTAELSTCIPFPPALQTCPECEVEFCPKTEADCPRGVAPDPCSCCAVGHCLLSPGDRCLDPTVTPAISETDLGKYGSCGDSMTCLQRTDLEPESKQESLCTCLSPSNVCGSDNRTYESICHLENSASSVLLAHAGPCETAPEIISGPEGVSIAKDYPFALDCEVRGFPVPAVTWEFIGTDGSSMTLPGDDTSIMVQTRGGPEPSMLTSWVQIMLLRGEDAGTYICIASNSHGTATAAANINIV